MSVATSLALRVLGAAATVAFLMVGFTPLPQALTRWMTRVDPLRPAEAIVVLAGAGVRGDGELTDVSLRRTIHGIQLYHRNLAPLLVLSGPVSQAGYVEAEVRRALATACGVAPTAILTVSRGRTTWDEGMIIGDLLRQRAIGRIVLVADGEGMGRAAAVFAKRGFDVIAAPTETPSLDGPPEGRLDELRRVAMELLAWLYYRASGYI